METPTQTPDRTSWHTQPIEAVEEKLNARHQRGLQAVSIDERREAYGENVLENKKRFELLKKIVRQFKNPLVIILVIAALATVFLQEYLDALVIAVALLINVVIGTLQEERASKAFEKLNQSQEKFANVIRDGKRVVVPAEDVVVGDVVVLEAGSYVPADTRLFFVRDMKVNEAALTGEWEEVEKGVGEVERDAPVAERENMAWMGTLVTSGEARGIIVAVGKQTELGRIAESLVGESDVVTPIQKNIVYLSRFLSIASLMIVTLIFFLGIVRGEPLAEMLLIAIAIAVSIVPEGLPAAVTAVLAIGMEKILKRGGLVRNLLAAETLGSTTVIMTDKTGTLTQAKMSLAELVPTEVVTRRDTEHLPFETRLLLHARLTSDAFVEERDGETVIQGRPIERAILEKSMDHGIEVSAYDQLDFLPFSSERRFAASLNRMGERGRKTIFFSGAPEFLLAHASQVMSGSDTEKLSEVMKQELERIQQERSAEGKRLIAIGHVDVAEEKIPRNDSGTVDSRMLERLIFDGFLVFEDPIREDVPAAIAKAKAAGARVIMVTGDNPATALSIARQAGIVLEDEEPVTGTDLETLSDEELLQMMESRHVFARVVPTQKLRMATLLRSQDEIVAMTGDGVNDAPALRSADIGVAVGSGTEVAKEASDLILLDNSFSIIVAAIEEGRRIIDNLKKIFTHLVATSFGEVFLITGALVVGAPLPILTAQILWVNIIEGGFMNFAFAFEPVSSGVMKRDPRDTETRTILTDRVRNLILIGGSVTGIFTLAIFLVLLSLDTPIEIVRTVMFAVLSLDALFFTLSIKNLHEPIWKINFFSNKYLLGALFFSGGLFVATLMVEPLRELLGLTVLTTPYVILLACVAFFDIANIELAKYFVFKKDRHEKSSDAKMVPLS